MEDWVSIRNLKSKNPKMSNREIGRLLNLSQNTVRKALLNDVGPKYVRKKYDKEIDKFKSIIEEMIFVKKLNKCRIFNELVAKGYKGSKISFYRYCANINDVNKRTFKPYGTEPGEQSKFDWSEYKVPIANKLTKVYVFSFILSFSRYRVYEASLSQSQSSIFAAIENSFIETGGVTERIQTDNAKSFVIDASRNNFQWNPNYLNFCGYYAIKPTRSLPSRPWSKGKGNVVIKDEYYKNHSSQQGNWKRLMQTFANIFPEYSWFIDKLQSQKRINRNYHLSQILGLLKFYKTDDLTKATKSKHS